MWLIALVLLAIAAYFIVRLLLTKNEQSEINSEAAMDDGTSRGATHSGDASLPGAGNSDEAIQNANAGGEPQGNPGGTPAVAATVAATAGDTTADAATAGIATGAVAAGVAIGAAATAGDTAADAAVADAAAAGVTTADAASSGVTTDAAASPATASATESSAAAPALSGNHMLDIQDMLKILNLRDSDASRLAISREQYNSLKTGDAGDFNSEQVQAVISRLQRMMG